VRETDAVEVSYCAIASASQSTRVGLRFRCLCEIIISVTAAHFPLNAQYVHRVELKVKDLPYFDESELIDFESRYTSDTLFSLDSFFGSAFAR